MYGKAFASMFTGSMFGKPSIVFAVWSYVLANQRPAKIGGVCTVELNPLLLAPMFATSPEEIVKAIGVLMAPDAASRSPEEDGRRLVHEGGVVEGPSIYRVVNGSKYRAIRDEDERRAQVSKAVRKHREKNACNHSNQSKPRKAQAEVVLEGEKDPEVESENARASDGPEFVAVRAFRANPLTLRLSEHDFGSWRADWEWIGKRPAAELAAAVATLARAAWAQANPHACTPGHIRKHWQAYASGKEPGQKTAPVSSAATSPAVERIRAELAAATKERDAAYGTHGAESWEYIEAGNKRDALVTELNRAEARAAE